MVVHLVWRASASSHGCCFFCLLSLLQWKNTVLLRWLSPGALQAPKPLSLRQSVPYAEIGRMTLFPPMEGLSKT